MNTTGAGLSPTIFHKQETELTLEMKKKILIAAIVLSLLSVIVDTVPIIVSALKSRTLSGKFNLGSSCMGGLELSLNLGEDKTFQHSPDHQDRGVVG